MCFWLLAHFVKTLFIFCYDILYYKLTHWIWVLWPSHEKIWLRAGVRGICSHEKFRWSLGWQEWLATSAQNSWRNFKFSGHLRKGSCIISTGQWVCGTCHLCTMARRVPGRTLFPLSGFCPWKDYLQRWYGIFLRNQSITILIQHIKLQI